MSDRQDETEGFEQEPESVSAKDAENGFFGGYENSAGQNPNPRPRDVTYAEQNAPVREPPKEGMATASLVLGIASLVTLCCCSVIFVIPIVCAVLSLIFAGIYAKNPGDGKGKITAGRICSIIALVLAAILIFLLIITPVILRSINFAQYFQEWAENNPEDFTARYDSNGRMIEFIYDNGTGTYVYFELDPETGGITGYSLNDKASVFGD